MSNFLLSGAPAYVGTKANMPPNLYNRTRRPISTDINYSIGDFWLYTDPTPGTNYQELYTLVSLKGNSNIPGAVAKWATVTEGGGSVTSLTTEDSTVVVPIAGNINVVGSTNMTTTGDVGTGTVNVVLKDSILLPATTGANVGVIALGTNLTTDRFIHNYSATGAAGSNTFIGRLSGNFTTIVGTNNTGIGANSLVSLTSGTNNVALGRLAGAGITTGSNNILIGNTGQPAENATIRIGNTATQTRAFVAGIYNTIIASTPTPNTVTNVGFDGQLGQVEFTSSGATIAITQPSNGVINLESLGSGGGSGGQPFSFLYVQNASTTVPDPGPQSLGTEIILTKVYDVGNNVFPGGGTSITPATFTAPVTGKYYLEVYILNMGTFPANPIQVNIITTARTYSGFAKATPVPNQMFCSAVADMTMGDTATFEQVVGNIIQGNTANPGLNPTRISGFLIPEGGSGGNFSQPFLGIAQADAVAVGGTPYFLGSGSAAPMVEQYDIGNNFNPGDGAGVPASFTAPETGIYSFTIAVRNTAGTNFCLFLYNNAAIVYGRNPEGAVGTSTSQMVEFNLSLTVGDVVTFAVNNSGGPGSVTLQYQNALGLGGAPIPRQTFVSGYRIA